MVAIFIDNLTKQFGSGDGRTRAVDSISLNITSGDLFFLLGPSGCGKTTLLRMIAGFTSPSAGRILFDTRDISAIPPHRRDTGMVFQSYALWPHMTVSENVAFGLDARGIKNPDRSQRIGDALSLVRMESLADRRPSQLSGGQQQRVALARALAIRPQCLLLDEPLSNLDAQLRLEMRGEIRRIVKESGTTAIYVTHDQKEALSMADSIAVLNAGKLEQVGTPAELYRRPATRFVAGFVGESNFLNGRIESVNSNIIVVKTAVGPILAAAVAGKSPVAAVGNSVTVAFRPEAATVSSDDRAPAGANVNRLPGKTLSTTYLGEMAEHAVLVAGLEQPIKIFEMNPRFQSTPPVPGVDVSVLIPPDQMMLVAD